MRVSIAGCAVLLSLLLPISVRAQETGQITGLVTSDVGQPLGGVLVSVQGTSLSAVTAPNGRYAISDVPVGDHVIRTSSVGYATIELTVTVGAGAPAVLDIQLDAEAIELAEIVAVGYGTQRRGEITGSVAHVSSEDFIAGPARDAGSLIAGQMPGLVVNTPSGNPRAGTEVFLRGITSIRGSGSPLVLIDNVPGNLETVAAADIESISVLKDGSAAAIYGTRAQNGVILITTKKHAGPRATFRYDGYVTQQRIYTRPDLLDAGDYRQLIGDGVEFEDFGQTTNWLDLILREPVSHVHNVSLTGGGENTNYTASLSYENSQGILIRSDNKESAGRFNIRHSMYDGLLQGELNVVHRTESAFTGPNYDIAWRHAFIRNPTDQVFDEEGGYQQRATREYTNPLSLINEENGETEFRNTRIHGTVTLRPVRQLGVSAMAGTSTSSLMSGEATTFNHVNTVEQGLNGTASASSGSARNRILEITGTYTENLGAHNIDVVGGYSYQDNDTTNLSASNEDFPTDLFGFNSLESGSGITDGRASVNSGRSSWKLIGFFGRVNYDWDNRFLLTTSARYERHSRFGEGHKGGLFPALSAGWRLSEESFIRDNISWISDLRLRGGYGVTGVAPNQSLLSLTSFDFGARFPFNGQWVQGIEPARNPNPDLKWEEKHELNVGMNFSLFDFRLSGSLDIYRRDTEDLLFNFSVPVPPNLTGSLLANVGTMRNEGIEAELSYDVITRPGLRWRTSANWSTTRNKLISLSDQVFQAADFFNAGGTGAPIQTFTHRVEIGGPIGNFYGWDAVDLDENGEWIVLDAENEPIPIDDAVEADKRVLGNGIPKHFVAWNNQLQVGSFDLSLNMRGAFGFQVLNFMRMFYENPTITLYNGLRAAYFDPPFGRTDANGEPLLLRSPQAYVSYYVENGDYWKIDNATLGYTLDPELLARLGGALSSARIYISGRNLLTLTGYKGMDPEVPFANDPFTAGNDSRDLYPTTRAFTAGVTISF